MPLTIEDAESSFLKGKAEFDQFVFDFENQWWEPQVMDLLGTLIKTMPMAGRMLAPDATATIERIYRERRGG